MESKYLVIIFGTVITAGIGYILMEDKRKPATTSLIPSNNNNTVIMPSGEIIVSDIQRAYDAAIDAGFEGDSLKTILAIAGAESNYNDNAEGDSTLVNATWGKSIGMTQVRSLQPDVLDIATDADAYRDATKLKDTSFNFVAAYEISKGGTDFTDWSTFIQGKYLAFLPKINELLA